MGLEEILAALPGTGLGGLVVALFVWVLRTGREDRVDYRTALASAVAAHQAELTGVRERAKEDAEAADAEIADLRRRLADAHTVTDGERGMRRDAALEVERVRLWLTVAQEKLAIAQGQEVIPP